MASSTRARWVPADLPVCWHRARHAISLQHTCPHLSARKRLLQVHAPAALPARDVLKLVHSAEFVDSFCSGTLGAVRCGVLLLCCSCLPLFECLACSCSSCQLWQGSCAFMATLLQAALPGCTQQGQGEAKHPDK